MITFSRRYCESTAFVNRTSVGWRERFPHEVLSQEDLEQDIKNKLEVRKLHYSLLIVESGLQVIHYQGPFAVTLFRCCSVARRLQTTSNN